MNKLGKMVKCHMKLESINSRASYQISGIHGKAECQV